MIVHQSKSKQLTSVTLRKALPIAVKVNRLAITLQTHLFSANFSNQFFIYIPFIYIYNNKMLSTFSAIIHTYSKYDHLAPCNTVSTSIQINYRERSPFLLMMPRYKSIQFNFSSDGKHRLIDTHDLSDTYILKTANSL